MSDLNINFLSFFETAPPTIILKPDIPKFTIVTANKAYLEVTASRLEDLLGKGFLDAFPENPSDTVTGNVKALRDSLTQAVVTKQQHILPSQKYDIPVWGTDRFNVRYWKATNSPVLNEAGEVECIVHVTLDITSAVEAAQKERFAYEVAEAQRKATYQLQERLRLAIDSAALGTWYVDVNTRELIASARLKELFGYYPNEVISLNDAITRIREDYRTAVLEAIELSIKQRQPYDMEYPVIGFHNKELRWVKATGKLYDAEPGIPANFSGTISDITKSKLEELEEQLTNVTLMQQAETMAEMGSWEYDLATRSFSWSRGMYALFGLESKEAVTPDIFVQFAVDEEKSIAEEIALKLKQFESFEQVIKINKKGDARILKIRSVKLNNDFGELLKVLGVMIDVTDTIISEEKLTDLNNSLERRNKELEQKNEDLSTFAFVASHDLREPLRKIATFSSLLIEREQQCLTEKGKGYLQRMRQSVERLQLLIDDILALAQLQTKVIITAKLDLNKILERVKEELEQEIRESQVEITAHSLPTIAGNETMIFSLFNNLIGNSIKYSRTDTLPKIEICATIIKKGSLTIDNVDPDMEYIQLTFKDNGIGFDPKFSSQIFQIFKRLHNKNDYAGTGIGLALCKKIMENHQGFITAESTPGSGSVFSCYFPIIEKVH